LEEDDHMSKTVAAYGVRFSLPDDWSVRFIPPSEDPDSGEYQGLNVHAGSLAVSLDDDSRYAAATIGTLGPLDIVFALNESRPHEGSGVIPGKGIWAAGKPPVLSVRDFNPATLQRSIPGQLGIQYRCTLHGRPMDFYIVLGSTAADKNLAGVNEILQSLEAASSTDATDYQEG
jgi:hypothetical protein